jgi:cytochrome c oxidase assembly protein subunit 15
VWTALELGAPPDSAERPPRNLRRAIELGLCLAVVTLLSGAFVAGLDGGKIYNTFPLMGGRVVPPGYFQPGAGWRNPFENPAAAQFHHRLLAMGTAALLLWLAVAGRRRGVPASLRRATTAAALVALLQVTLGITTLLLHVPIVVAVLHQVTGVGVLTAMLVATHRARAVAQG